MLNGLLFFETGVTCNEAFNSQAQQHLIMRGIGTTAGTCAGIKRPRALPESASSYPENSSSTPQNHPHL
jgi:hypothetical protein